MAVELPILDIGTAKAWRTWLRKNHATSAGIRLRFLKKAFAEADSINYASALDEALCWGWIDAQVQRGDAESYLQRFMPRGPRSTWSKINQGHIARLTAAQRMQPAGLAAVAAAKADGRWDRAYSSPANASVPDDLAAALKLSPAAFSFFQKLSSANRYAILYRIETAVRPETRARRIAQNIAMLERGETHH